MGRGLGFVRRRALALVALAGLSSVFVVSGASPHAGAEPAVTPLGGALGSMVVDPATNHVFTSLVDASAVKVFDLDGNLVTTITGEAGARGMVLVGDKIYVVASNAGAIDEIDTGTLTRTRRLASGVAGMTDIAYSAGALWVTSPSAPNAGLVKVAISDGTITPYSGILGYYDTGLVAAPGLPNTLLAYQPGMSPVYVTRVDVSTTPPTKAAAASLLSPTISNVRDLAISPDGTTFVPAGGAPYQFDEFRTDNLSATGLVYPANAYPTAVAMTSAAGGLFAGGINGIYDRDIVVYPLRDSSAAVASYDFGATSQTVEPHGLAFSPSGDRVFAVTGSQGAGDTLRVLVLPNATSTTTTSSAPTTTSTSSTTTSTTTKPLVGGATPAVLSVTPTSVPFGNQRVATYGAAHTVTVKNTGGSPLSLSNMVLTGTNSADFFGATDCFAKAMPATLAPGASCRAVLYFAPLKTGARHGTLALYTTSSKAARSIALSGTGTTGYFLAGAHGQIAQFGDAVYHGDASKLSLHAPMVSIATTTNGAGYWLLGRDGGIFTFGNAKFYGSTGNLRLNQPVVGMTPTHDGAGYWLVASDGGIFAFGDAKFYGSTGNLRLNKPIVGMTVTPTGHGYWLVASDGGVFAFGDAKFYGSTGNIALSKPIVGMSVTPAGHGYWMVASDGGIFAFGDAKFYGSAAGSGASIVGIATTPDGRGYWMASRTGRVFNYGDAAFYGDLRSIGVNDVIGIATTAPPIPSVLLPFVGAAAPGAGRTTTISGGATGLRGMPLQQG